MTLEDGVGNMPVSDLDRVLQKLAHTEYQLQQAQEHINALKAEDESKLTLAHVNQQTSDAPLEFKGQTCEQCQSKDRKIEMVQAQLKRERKQRDQVLHELRSQMSAIRRNHENLQTLWNSDKAILQIDLAQLRTEAVHSQRQHGFSLHVQGELTRQYVRCAEEITQSLHVQLGVAGEVNAKLQNEIVKLSLEKASLGERLSRQQTMLIKIQETTNEMALSHAAAIKQRDTLIADLRKEIDRSRTIEERPQTGRKLSAVSSDLSLEESALFREFNSNLFERLAASANQIDDLKNQVYVLEGQLAKNRLEFHNHVGRIEAENSRLHSELENTKAIREQVARFQTKDDSKLIRSTDAAMWEGSVVLLITLPDAIKGQYWESGRDSCDRFVENICRLASDSMEKGPGHKTAFTPFKRSGIRNQAPPGATNAAVVAAVIPPETCLSISNAVARVRSARNTLEDVFMALDQVDLGESEQIMIQDLFREATGVNAISVSRHDPSSTIRVCNMQAEWLNRIASQLHTVYQCESSLKPVQNSNKSRPH